MQIVADCVASHRGWEIVGPPCAPAVVVLGGISAHRHVCAHGGDPAPGWWEGVAGRGHAIDPLRYRVIGCDFLDGGCGPDGRPERVVTTHDQADAVASVLDDAGIARVHAVVGASYGGMVGLAFAERYPDRLEHLIVIGAAHRAHPMITAQRIIQRRIVELGLETRRTHDALALARALAMTTYRSAREFADRFDRPPSWREDAVPEFAVESYLLHHGERFAALWSASRFLALSLSSDLHRVEPGLVRTPTLIVAAENDTVAPRRQLEELADGIRAPSRLVDLPSINGHDAFLTERESLGRILHSALGASDWP
jgi:homoserine O-acetyltransferase